MTISKPTAIIAEDVPEMRDLLQKTLEHYGCNIIAAELDGAAALKQIEKLKPDMVFLDIEMPGMTGYEILDAIQNKSLNIYPVMVSGHSDFNSLKASIEKGAKGFVSKPYTSHRIGEMVSNFASIK